MAIVACDAPRRNAPRELRVTGNSRWGKGGEDDVTTVGSVLE